MKDRIAHVLALVWNIFRRLKPDGVRALKRLCYQDVVFVRTHGNLKTYELRCGHVVTFEMAERTSIPCPKCAEAKR
jgi:hypothetical protein